MSPTQRPTFGVLAKKTMQKIALEEAISMHVFNPTTTLPPVEGTAELPYVNTHYVSDVKDRLTNVDARVKAMDEAGVALTVVSLTMPGIEGIFDPQIAVKTAQNVNDEIYELYTAGPHVSRFRAFGCVAMQDPQAAATEAERCVQKLGFVGILINGYSNIGDANTVQYLDEPQLLLSGPRLRNSASRFIFIPVFRGSPWGFGVETATHAIRLMISGLFDKHPSLKVILGHCGEGIPFSLNRIDHRIRHFQSHHIPCRLSLQEYWEKNFYITTAGIMNDGTFFDALKSCGEDRLLWSVDYPYEDYNELGPWFDNLDLNENSKAKIGWENARRILKLD